MPRPFQVASILGIPIRLDASWLFIVVLLTASLSLASSRHFPSLSWPIWVFMGLAGSLLLFGSVLAHELSHAVVAIRRNISIRGITLFIFGGAAEMSEEPPDASAELQVALAGPAMSLVLAVSFWGVYLLGRDSLPAPVIEIVQYVALMNSILLAFNIVPGFPLDGGRVLRALLWHLWDDLKVATRTATAVGSGFGSLIIFLGLLYVYPFENLVAGIWYVFIGLFLRSAARSGYRHVLVRDQLRGVKVGDLLDPQIVAIPPELRLEDIVQRVMLTSGMTEFPVAEGMRFLGMVGLREIRSVEREMWGQVTAAEIMVDTPRATLSSWDDADRLLPWIVSEDTVIPVVDEGKLVGVVRPREIMRRIG